MLLPSRQVIGSAWQWSGWNANPTAAHCSIMPLSIPSPASRPHMQCFLKEGRGLKGDG